MCYLVLVYKKWNKMKYKMVHIKFDWLRFVFSWKTSVDEFSHARASVIIFDWGEQACLVQLWWLEILIQFTLFLTSLK